MASRKLNQIPRDLSFKIGLRKNNINAVLQRELGGMCTAPGSHTSTIHTWTWSQTSRLKSAWQQLQASPFGCHLKVLFHQANEHLNVIALLFARQCNAIAALRIRRGTQIANFYSRLYDRQAIKHVVERCYHNSQRKPLTFLLGAVLFAWDQQKFSEGDINT